MNKTFTYSYLNNLLSFAHQIMFCTPRKQLKTMLQQRSHVAFIASTFDHDVTNHEHRKNKLNMSCDCCNCKKSFAQVFFVRQKSSNISFAICLQLNAQPVRC